MERKPGRIKRDHASGRQADGVGVDALEVIQPEADVHIGGIVFGEIQLGPAHGLIEPAGQRIAGPHLRGCTWRPGGDWGALSAGNPSWS